MLLRASISQRVAIVHMMLPMLQRRMVPDFAITSPPAHLKLLGEAGSGKSMVLNAIQRLVQRLNASAKAVMSLAPTGAVAISMGPNGSTIQNVIQAFRLSNVSKRKQNQNCLHEQDMPLNDCKLAKLRARLGFDPVTGTCVTKCIVIDEISMVGASLFWAIHCRLCQALEMDDVRSVKNGFANMDIAVIGDFGQLDPVCATSLVSNPSKAKGLNASGIQLFHNLFSNQVVLLESQHRLNLHNEQNVHLRRLQLHARDGKLDDIDFAYIKSLDLNRKTDAEKKQFLAHRVLHVHFYVRDVILGNIAEVKQVSTNQDCFPSILLNKTKGGRCSNIEGDVNQLPPMGMFVKSLPVLCTVNGLGYPQLTNILGIANGTRGTVVAVLHTHSTLPEPDVVVIVDFPSYAGPSLMGKGWPTTWVPVSNVTRRCKQGCCERTGIPLAPASHITLFKCQGLTCGNNQPHEKMLLYCNNIQSAESKWPRSLYVALTRTIDASDLALVNYGEFKKELWNLINEAKYHEHNETRKDHDLHISQQLQMKYAEYVTDDGWLHFLSQIDELACDGISDATCSTRDPLNCANSGCLCCSKLYRV